MRRSVQRQKVAELVASVDVSAYAHSIEGLRLKHAPGLDLAKPGAAAPHLSFTVASGRTVPLGRGNDRTLYRTQVVVEVAFALRATMQADGVWTDLDLADHLAEDIARVVLASDDLMAEPVELDTGTAGGSDTDGRIRLVFNLVHAFGV